MHVNNENLSGDRQWFDAMCAREKAERTNIVGVKFREFMTQLPETAPSGPYNVYISGQENPINDMPYATFPEAHLHAASAANWKLHTEVREVGNYDRPMFTVSYLPN